MPDKEPYVRRAGALRAVMAGDGGAIGAIVREWRLARYRGLSQP